MKCLLVTVSALWILLPQSYELIRLEVLKVLPKFTKLGRTKPGLESNVTSKHTVCPFFQRSSRSCTKVFDVFPTSCFRGTDPPSWFSDRTSCFTPAETEVLTLSFTLVLAHVVLQKPLDQLSCSLCFLFFF